MNPSQRDEPRAVRLTTALMKNLEDVAVKAVIARDLPSLGVLHELHVDLTEALMQSVRSGFHEMTRGLRQLGAPVTEYVVDLAVSKSPESYWQLCGDEATPILPEVALRIAVAQGKFSLAQELLDRWHISVRPDVIAQVEFAKRPVPRPLLEKLFATLPDSGFTDNVLRVAAMYGTPSIMDRAVRVTKNCDTVRLAAIAMKSANVPVAQELVAGISRIPPSIIRDYIDASYPRAANFREVRLNSIDTAFLKMFCDRDVELRMADVSSLIEVFLERKACPIWKDDKNGGLEFFRALHAVLKPQDASQLIGYVTQSAVEVLTRLAPRNRPPAFESEVLALLHASADTPAIDDATPQP